MRTKSPGDDRCARQRREVRNALKNFDGDLRWSLLHASGTAESRVGGNVPSDLQDSVSTQDILMSIANEGHHTCNFLPLRKSGRDEAFGGSAMLAEVLTDTSGGCWWLLVVWVVEFALLVRRGLLLRTRERAVGSPSLSRDSSGLRLLIMVKETW
jgi:hypothetical protein